MRLKLALPMASVFFLAACATPGSLRQGKPDLDEVTNAPSERVAGCIGDKLEDLGLGSAGVRLSTRPTTNGYSISGDQTLPGFYAGGGTDTILLIDISKVDSKTRVQLFTHVLMGGPDYISLIRGCL